MEEEPTLLLSVESSAGEAGEGVVESLFFSFTEGVEGSEGWRLVGMAVEQSAVSSNLTLSISSLNGESLFPSASSFSTFSRSLLARLDK